MFQFRRFPTYAYLIQRRLTEYCSAGFPHSEISGSTVICTSPKLIAACHVLHRLLMPRHSPCALLRLTYFLVNKKVSKENFHGRPPYGSVSCFLCCPTLRSTKKGLALVLKRLNYAGSEFFEIVLCYPFRKVPQIIFVSLCCLLFILGYFVQFSRCVSSSFRNQIQTLNLLKCLHPISRYLRDPSQTGRGESRAQAFGKAKTLPQGQFICPEDVLSPLGLPI